jgi:hypothetical protein
MVSHRSFLTFKGTVSLDWSLFLFFKKTSPIPRFLTWNHLENGFEFVKICIQIRRQPAIRLDAKSLNSPFK